MRPSRRTAAAVVSTTAAALSCLACGLLSGADQLHVGVLDDEGGIGSGTSSGDLDATGALDGVPRDSAQGSMDAAVPDGPTAGDGGDAGGRLRDVTFEDGTLLGIHGGDSMYGSAFLATGLGVLSGHDSMRIDKSLSGIQVDVPTLTELFATALVRLDNIGAGQASLFGILPEVGGTLAEVRVQETAGSQVVLVIGGMEVASGGTVTVGTVYRVGVHVRQDSMASLIEVFASPAGAAFGQPVVTSATSARLGRTIGVRMGVLDSGGLNTKATFDDLFIDTLAMPPP